MHLNANFSRVIQFMNNCCSIVPARGVLEEVGDYSIWNLSRSCERYVKQMVSRKTLTSSWKWELIFVFYLLCYTCTNGGVDLWGEVLRFQSLHQYQDRDSFSINSRIVRSWFVVMRISNRVSLSGYTFLWRSTSKSPQIAMTTTIEHRPTSTIYGDRGFQYAKIENGFKRIYERCLFTQEQRWHLKNAFTNPDVEEVWEFSVWPLLATTESFRRLTRVREVIEGFTPFHIFSQWEIFLGLVGELSFLWGIQPRGQHWLPSEVA